MIYVARIWSLVETPDEIFAGNNIFLFVSFEGNFTSSLISLKKTSLKNFVVEKNWIIWARQEDEDLIDICDKRSTHRPLDAF